MTRPDRSVAVMLPALLTGTAAAASVLGGSSTTAFRVLLTTGWFGLCVAAAVHLARRRRDSDSDGTGETGPPWWGAKPAAVATVAIAGVGAGTSLAHGTGELPVLAAMGMHELLGLWRLSAYEVDVDYRLAVPDPVVLPLVAWTAIWSAVLPGAVLGRDLVGRRCGAIAGAGALGAALVVGVTATMILPSRAVPASPTVQAGFAAAAAAWLVLVSVAAGVCRVTDPGRAPAFPAIKEGGAPNGGSDGPAAGTDRVAG